jgi:deoxyribonuclease-4
MHISDDELAATAGAIQQTGLKLFIHSQYLINLCQTPGVDDDYHTKLLIKNLQYGRAIGSKGVVVHVGKYTDKPLQIAMANMRTNLLLALEHATPECPILLETPAGQGTETLQNQYEFTDFVLSLGATKNADGTWKTDPRIRVCVDTCHVFACGYQPLDYVKHITTHAKNLIKLIHYNDSATPCGSHLDRHAYMGTGHVGMEGMTNIAKHCHAHNLPMLIE